MVFGINIGKVVTISIVGLLAAVFFKDAFGEGLGTTLGKVGTGGQAIGGALTSTGQGIFSFLEGIGSGSAKLLNPLFTLKELAGPIVGIASGGTSEETPMPASENNQSLTNSGTTNSREDLTRRIFVAPISETQAPIEQFISPSRKSIKIVNPPSIHFADRPRSPIIITSVDNLSGRKNISVQLFEQIF